MREPQPTGASADEIAAGRLWVVAFALALLLYALTMAPDLVWQDAGEYQWNVGRFAWPWVDATVWVRPGEAVRVHPWFLVLSRLLWIRPLWNYAFAATFCSALGTALAVANVALLVRLLTGHRWAAVVGGATFGLGHAVWAHACVSEVYGWAAAFLGAECLCAWAWTRRRQARWLLLLFFLDGVAISNHLMAALGLAVFGTWLLVEWVRRRAPAWVLPAAVGCWLAGGALQWVVVGLEYARTGDLAATVRSATVGEYGGAVLNAADLPRLLKNSVLYVGLNYPTPLALAGLVGAVALARRRQAMATLVLALAAVYLAWAARYKVPDQYGFFVPFYVPASVLIGVGAARLARGRGAWMRWILVALAAVPVGVYAVLPGAARRAEIRFFQRELPYRDPYTYFLRPWQRGCLGARQFAEDVMRSAPKRSIILADTTSSPPLKCLIDVERQRAGGPADLLVVDPYDARFDPALGAYWGSENLLPALAGAGRRVFVVSKETDYQPEWVAAHARVVPFGRTADGRPLLYEVKPRAQEGPR